MTRRDFYRYGSIVLSGLVKLAVAVPAVAFLASPLRKKGPDAGEDTFETLTSLSQLAVGVPRSFAIIRIGPTPGSSIPASRSARSG